MAQQPETAGQLLTTVSAYRSLVVASRDWEAFTFASKAAGPELLDSIVVERTIDEISHFHFCFSIGRFQGYLASAICAVIWPPALLAGALAGSVGGRLVTEVRRGLSPDAIKDLGMVLDRGPFLLIAIGDPLGIRANEFDSAVDVATVPLDSNLQALRSAHEQDDKED